MQGSIPRMSSFWPNQILKESLNWLNIIGWACETFSQDRAQNCVREAPEHLRSTRIHCPCHPVGIRPELDSWTHIQQTRPLNVKRGYAHIKHILWCFLHRILFTEENEGCPTPRCSQKAKPQTGSLWFNYQRRKPECIAIPLRRLGVFSSLSLNVKQPIVCWDFEVQL